MVCAQSIKRGCPTRSLGSGQSWSMVKLNLAQGNPGYTGNGKRKNPGKSVQRKAPPGRKCSGTTTKKARQTQTSLGVIKREKGPPPPAPVRADPERKRRDRDPDYGPDGSGGSSGAAGSKDGSLLLQMWQTTLRELRT